MDAALYVKEQENSFDVIIVDSSKISADGKNTRLVPVTTVNGVGFLTAFKPDKIILKSTKGEHNDKRKTKAFCPVECSVYAENIVARQ